jgi:hypothetical protein
MYYALLPPNEQKALRREYRVRVAIVLLFMMSAAGLIGVVSLIPGYFHALSVEKEELATVAKLQKEQKTAGTVAIQDELKKDIKILDLLSKGSLDKPISEVIKSVVGLRMASRMTNISVSKAATTTVVAVQGISPTRDELLALRDRLESISVRKIDVPISLLAQSSSIQYTLQFTYKPQ